MDQDPGQGSNAEANSTDNPNGDGEVSDRELDELLDGKVYFLNRAHHTGGACWTLDHGGMGKEF